MRSGSTEEVVKALLLIHGPKMLGHWFALGKTTNLPSGGGLPSRCRVYKMPKDGAPGAQPAGMEGWEVAYGIACAFQGCKAAVYVGYKPDDPSRLLVLHSPAMHHHQAGPCSHHRKYNCTACGEDDIGPASCEQGVSCPSLYGAAAYATARLGVMHKGGVVVSPAALYQEHLLSNVEGRTSVLYGNHTMVGRQRDFVRLKAEYKDLRIQELPGNPQQVVDNVVASAKEQGIHLTLDDTNLAMARVIAKDLQEQPSRKGLEETAGPILYICTYPEVIIILGGVKQQMLYEFMCCRPLEETTALLGDASMQIVRDIDGKKVRLQGSSSSWPGTPDSSTCGQVAVLRVTCMD